MFDLCSPIALDCLCTTTHLAPNNILSLNFQRHSDEFFPNRESNGTQDYKLVIVDLHLRCNHVRLLPEARKQVLSGDVQNYRMAYTVVSDYPLSTGNKTASIRLHHGGVLPNQIAVGMVPTTAFNGA